MKIVKNAVALSLVAGAAVLAADASAAPTGGPITAYVKFVGSKTGVFNGEVTQKGREKQSLVLGYDYELSSAIDASTGHASGKRQHSPFVITKELGSSSPQIYNAAATNEVLTSVEVDLVQTNAAGISQTLYKYILTNAQIVDVHQSLTTNCVGSAPCRAAGPDGNIVGPDTPTESIAMTFERIEEVDVPGNTSATDELQTAQ